MKFPRVPTKQELYWWIRGIAAQEDNDLGRPVSRQPGVSKAAIPAAYVSGNPNIKQWHESETTLGSKIHKVIQAAGNRNAALAANDSVAIGHDPDGNKQILGKLVNVGAGIVDADYIMGLRPVAPGNTLLLSALNQQTTTSATPVDVKRFLVTRPGKYRIKGALSRSGGQTAAQVVIELHDGTKITASTQATYSGTVFPTFGSQFTLDMDVDSFWGSFIVVQLSNNSGPTQTGYIKDVTISYQDATASLGVTDLVITD